MKQTAVNFLTLDRALARYGPETGELRAGLKHAVEGRVDRIWPESSGRAGNADDRVVPPSRLNEWLADRIAALTPATDAQRALQARAMELAERLLEQRWLAVSQTEALVPTAFLVILVFWLTVAFGSYGLFAPMNGTVTVALFLRSVSVAAALFLVLELGSPFDGGVKVSGEPMRRAIVLLDR